MTADWGPLLDVFCGREPDPGCAPTDEPTDADVQAALDWLPEQTPGG